MPIEIKELSFSYDSKPFIDNLDLKIVPTKNLIKKFFAESLE